MSAQRMQRRRQIVQMISLAALVLVGSFVMAVIYQLAGGNVLLLAAGAILYIIAFAVVLSRFDSRR